MKKGTGLLALFVLLGCGLAYAADDMTANEPAGDTALTADTAAKESADAALKEPADGLPLSAEVGDKTAEMEAFPKSDIVSTATAAGNFKTLTAALEAAGLVDTLKGPGPFTVFAPSDEAFAKLAPGTVEEWLKPENKDKLVSVLTYHVVPGKIMAADVKTMKAGTVNGKAELDVVKSDTGVTVDGAKVVMADIDCSNGVIHVIDQVLTPKETPAAAPVEAPKES